jgi:hypothetical protein
VTLATPSERALRIVQVIANGETDVLDRVSTTFSSLDEACLAARNPRSCPA